MTEATPTWRNAPLRDVAFWQPQLDIRRTDDGTIYLTQKCPLPTYAARITEGLLAGASAHPDRVFLADRKNPDGGWRKLTYGQMAERVQRLAAWLLTKDLSVDRPLLILSGNDIDHAAMALAAVHIGVPHASIASNYALMGGDYARLRDVIDQITPGLAFADDATAYLPALAATAPDLPVVSVADVAGCESFAAACATDIPPAVEAAYQRITPDTVAKFLFTSGSTGSPKAVINTHRMITSNARGNTTIYAFMQTEPPVILDWTPWNHTAGGNKVFYMTMYAGGTLYIDDGRPTKAEIGLTIRNLKEISPTWYFNVPVGYDMLIPALREDAQLRENMFRDLKIMWYAGASLTAASWSALEELAVAATGTRILIATGLGSTETAPVGLACTWPQTTAGNIGLPTPGVTMKLVPVEDGKYDARIKGPNVTPGYWRAPDLTAKAFDEEGFYSYGDALVPADPDDLSQGFYFGGRTAENFKLDTGTWVSTGAVRLSLLEALGPDVLDVVITGADKPWLGALVFPRDPARIEDPALRADLAARLAAHAKLQSGSSTRVRKLLLLDTPPNKGVGEMTDKGSINQRLVLRLRADKVAALYDGADPAIINPA